MVKPTILMFGVVAKLFHGTLTRSILSLLCPFGHCGAGIAGSKKAPGSLSPEPVHMSKATWKANPGESPFLYKSKGSVPWGLRHACRCACPYSHTILRQIAFLFPYNGAWKGHGRFARTHAHTPAAPLRSYACAFQSVTYPTCVYW